ncbi:hypothetical protein SEN777SA01_41420 [Salmonella enterica subsp. enterica serovar Agona]|nr:hypothetical protein SEN47SA97_37070 [Salmonella enterica subsp. enterica serovar Agona]CAH2838373.1 hypothetical protein SEN777SA01_41420 [Salmonella enterica subsp. enterica serovar Agona]CAH2839229.1 hypothetical protein SEN1169SA97_40510 [Salmonella enterica subsp. enterica serovar Agona]
MPECIQAFYVSLTLSDGGVNTLSNQQRIFNAKQWKIHQGYIMNTLFKILVITLLIVVIGYVIVLHSLPPMRY